MNRHQHLLITCTAVIVAFLAALDTQAIEWSADAKGTWAFTSKPDKFTDDALLDLRFLNEKQSGETGFIRLSKDRNDFVRGDGKPIRFWAIGSDIYRRTGEEMDIHCRFLAKMGVNMVRLHTVVAATKEGDGITDVNEKEIAGIFRFIKAAKDNGIYITLSPYYGHHKTPKSWNLEGYDGINPWGAIFIDPRMQEGYKAWTKALYTRVNPHTGLALKDDPTLAIIQVHNEDSMFFWTMQRLPAPQMKRLSKLFGTWLTKKYGSLDKAKAAWDGQGNKDDDFANGLPALLSTWHMTQDWKGGTAMRVRDQVQFYAEHQRGFYAWAGKYHRKTLGCKQLMNATNWRTANDSKLKDIERWTYAALDIDAENEYYGSDYQHIGESTTYRIDPGHHLVNESVLHKPLELTVNYKQNAGHPFIVTETSWKNPNLYQSEGPFLVAAYQSLNGVDGVYWFSARDVTWSLDPRLTFLHLKRPTDDQTRHPWHKWSCSTPMLLGMFPANALMYRQAHLKQGNVVVREARSLDQLWDRQPPAIDDNEIYGVSRETEECKTTKRSDGNISRAAFLVGRVESELGSAKAKTNVVDFSKNLAQSISVIRSNTGEHAWDFDDGVCIVQSSKAAGVTGFLKGGAFVYALDGLSIKSNNEYATISLVAMDNQPLKQSKKVLVQVGTVARLTDWQVQDATFDFKKQKIKGKQIVDTGKPPWRIVNTDVSINIVNPHLTKATLLDVNGYAVKAAPAGRIDGGLMVTLPKNTMYLVLH